jgi:NADH:ubiquinone oxidoreductase subunit K
MDVLSTSLSLLLFFIGLLCIVTQRKLIKQVIGLKVMLQGVTLGLIHAGRLGGTIQFAETLVVSALIVETVVIAIAVALIVNVFRSDPSGDVDRLNRLRG